jgi:hypothetical protein
MDIAVIGMAGRFPGARNVHEFWTNLKEGKDVRRELSASSPPHEVPPGASAVRAAYVLDDIDRSSALTKLSKTLASRRTLRHHRRVLQRQLQYLSLQRCPRS